MKHLPLFAVLLVSCTALAQPSFTPAEQTLIDEHVFAGLPSTDIIVRQGYVLSFDHRRRVPLWVAYHIAPEYRDTPSRGGRFASYRADPDIDGEARDSEYTGFHATRGYARGHLAPYIVMGGHRDEDDLSAEDDEDDFLTIKQANYASNMAPQQQLAFNGSGGIWYALEEWVQKDLVVGQGREAWIIARTVFGPAKLDAIGPNADIEVPPHEGLH